MKKRSLLSLLAVVFMASGMLFTTGCGEDDTEAPVITLNDATNNSTVYGVEYTDPGATATDNDDKNPTLTASGEVDENIAGEHPIVYTATDKDGNSSSKTRTVTVDAAPYVISANGSANFSVDDTDPQVPVYTDNLTTSSSDFNKIYFSKFGWFDNASVYAELSGANTVNIPEQTINCGNDNVDRKFKGSGTFTQTTLAITYTVALADGSGEFSGTANYTKR